MVQVRLLEARMEMGWDLTSLGHIYQVMLLCQIFHLFRRMIDYEYDKLFTMQIESLSKETLLAGYNSI